MKNLKERHCHKLAHLKRITYKYRALGPLKLLTIDLSSPTSLRLGKEAVFIYLWSR